MYSLGVASGQCCRMVSPIQLQTFALNTKNTYILVYKTWATFETENTTGSSLKVLCNEKHLNYSLSITIMALLLSSLSYQLY